MFYNADIKSKHHTIKEGEGMTIGQFCSQCGITKDTARYYEKLGFLHPTQQPNGRKQYTAQQVQAVVSIRKLQAMDLTLAEIALLFQADQLVGEDLSQLDAAAVSTLRDCRALLQNTCKRVGEKLSLLTAGKQALEHSISKLDKLLDAKGEEDA